MRRIILDTSVCINVGRGVITANDWKLLEKYLKRRCRYFVSPLALLELVVGLGRGKAAYFAKNLLALRTLLAPGDRFLRFPGHFVIERVFGDGRRKKGFEPGNFTLWASALLNAQTKRQLRDGVVDFGSSWRMTFGFDFDAVIKDHLNGQAAFVREYENIRCSGASRTSEVWAEGFLSYFGIEPSEENRNLLISALDAVVTYVSALSELAITSNYNFEKNKNDWIDWQHLCYLADPLMYIVTSDGRLKRRISGSAQSERVLMWPELLTLSR